MSRSMLVEATYAAPELALVVGAIVGLLVGLYLPRQRQWLVGAVAAVAATGGLVLTLRPLDEPAMIAFKGLYAVDDVLAVARLAVLAGTLLTLALSFGAVRGHPRETEFYVLLLLGGTGACALAGAHDLLMLGAAYLLASAPLYALTGFAKDGRGTEAALKYYLMGVFLGVVMLVGITVSYGAAGGTTYAQLSASLTDAPEGLAAVGLVAVLAGLMFKAGGVPGHFWVPDAAEGAPRPVAAFVTTVPKVGALAAAFRLVEGPFARTPAATALIVAVLAAATMTLGNLAAFFQTDVRRLLGYSAISQVGYLLLAVTVSHHTDLAEGALLFYLAGYSVTNLGAFGVAASLPAARTLTDYGGLVRRRPGLGAALVVCLLGLIGTPPTAVFFGKLAVFTAAVDGGYAWLAVLAVVNTVASVFYYLRWVAPAFLGGVADTGRTDDVDRWAARGTYTAAAVSVVLGVSAGWLVV